MILRHYFLLLCLLCAAHLTGCRTAHPVDSRPNAEMQTRPIGVDSTGQNVASYPQNVASSIKKVPSSAPKGTKPGILSGIGNVFSSPEGRANRQAVRLAKATAGPKKLGKGAVYAPAATQVAAAYKAKGATIAAADSATVQVATNAVAGHDNTATQTATTQAAPGFWAQFGKPLGYVATAALVGLGGYLLYLVWAFIPRRKDNAA